MPLRLTFQGGTTIPIELDGILPSRLRGRPLGEVERTLVWHGNRQVALAELFRVTGNADDTLELEGDLSGVHNIGQQLDGGTIRVAGSVGRHLGAHMTGGEIHVAGNCGDWAGAEMHNGQIHIGGSAGDAVGGAYLGSPKGMTGGTILIRGDAGEQVGRGMRRGLVAVAGSVGPFAALEMLAGTVIVAGDCGGRAGVGMRRGTLAVLGTAAPLLASFCAAGLCHPQFMPLYLTHLRRLGFPVATDALGAAYHLYHGDLLATGRGEILTRAA